MHTHSRVGIVVGTAVAAALGGGAIALAAFSPVDSNGAVNACYSQKNGALRVVAPGSKCSNGEAALVWAQAGVPGPAGPAGPAGALSCADELRILAAVPAFAVTPGCQTSSSPSPAPSTVTLTGVTAAQVGVGQQGTGIVTLSAPAPVDTTVAISSSDPTVATAGNAVVLSGASAGTFTIHGISTGSAVLTATLGADSRTTTVTVTP